MVSLSLGLLASAHLLSPPRGVVGRLRDRRDNAQGEALLHLRASPQIARKFIVWSAIVEHTLGTCVWFARKGVPWRLAAILPHWLKDDTTSPKVTRFLGGKTS
mmetsp:Transcript_137936/g.294765  ORF Transcript_137936/g.294765 Transcript_137936/m.294765 type:complete len:103 (+) Transcript_137936:794-1102(+)